MYKKMFYRILVFRISAPGFVFWKKIPGFLPKLVFTLFLSLLIYSFFPAHSLYAQDDNIESPDLEDILGEDISTDAETEAKSTDENRKKKPTYRTISVAFSAGYISDIFKLSTIRNDRGFLALSPSSMAAKYFSTKNFITPEKEDEDLLLSSKSTLSSQQPLQSLESSSEMQGILLEGQLQKEFYNPLYNIPFFVRASFVYNRSVYGGYSQRTFGALASLDSELSALIEGNSLSASDYTGGKMSVQFKGAYLEVPVSFGVKIPIFVRTYLYGAFGLSYFRGGWEMEVEMDGKYAAVLASSFDESGKILKNNSPLTSSEKLKESIAFITHGISYNYMMGSQIMLNDNSAMFMELYYSSMIKTVYSARLSDKMSKLLTAAMHPEYLKEDKYWVKRIAAPVNFGGLVVKMGYRYYIF